MNIKHVISLVAGLVYAASTVIYVRHNLKGRIYPNIASLLIWSFMNFSQLIAVIVSKAWNTVPFLVVATVAATTNSLIALRSKRFFFSKFDGFAAGLAVLSLLVWAATGNAAWTVYILTLVGAITMAPLIRKVYKHPNLETQLPWRLNFVGATLLVVAIPSAAVVQWIVPAQQFICSALLNIGLSRKTSK